MTGIGRQVAAGSLACSLPTITFHSDAELDDLEVHAEDSHSAARYVVRWTGTLGAPYFVVVVVNFVSCICKKNPPSPTDG